MPHETREQAEQRARELGMDKSQVIRTKVGYFIAPQGMKSKIAKQVYGENRAKGKSKEYSAKIAWSIENKIKGE